MRALLARHLDPDRGSLFEVRELLLTYAVEWLAADPGASGHWEIFCEAVRCAFDPAVEGNWTDPAGQRSITIANGVESSQHLQELTGLWSRVDALLEGVAPEAVPAKAIVDLIELFEEWLRLAAGHTRGTAVPNETQRDSAATAAWAIYQTLLPFLHAHISLALRTQKALDLAQRWDVLPPETIEPLVLDSELVLFAGRRDVWEDAEDWIQQRDQDCTQLASLLVGLGPRDGTNRFVRLAQETELSGQVQEGGFVAMMAARLADEPAEWIPCACTAGSATMLHYMLREARQRGINVDATVVAASLGDPRLRGATVRAVLDGSQLDPVAELVVASLDAGDSWLLDSLFTKAEADAVLHALLVHPVMEVRATASLAFAVGVKHGPGLPSEWADDWARAFLDADHTTIQGHSRWRLQEVLKALAEERPGLLADWFEQRLSMPEPAWSGARHSELEPIAGGLPSAERERLARLCATSVVNDKTMLRHLLGQDADLAAQLLEDGTLDAEDALETLSGERDQGVELLVPVLLAHGIAAIRIARRICASRSWEGKESDAIQKDIEWFTSLLERSPGLQPVCEAALADLASDLERSLGEGVDEAIRGWS